MTAISVLLVDDHALFAEALQFQLSKQPDLGPVRAVTSAKEAVAVTLAMAPDVAVLDVNLDGSSGIDLINELLKVAPGCRILMLSESRSPHMVAEALRRGARGWLSKTVDVSEVVASIRGLARGEARLDPMLLDAVLPELISGADAGERGELASLTLRERAVLQLLVSGLSRQEIATELGLSANTIRTHTQNVLGKLGAHSTLEAVATALRLGLRASDT